MTEKLPKALYPGKLPIGGIELDCYVLEGGERVISGRGLQSALGFKARSGDALASFLRRKDISALSSEILKKKIENRLEFSRAGAGGSNTKTYGYDATVLVDIADLFIQARKDKKLQMRQMYLADQAEAILRAVAKVGIIALIDEATGFQKNRKSDALRLLLQAYLADEIKKWVKEFPDFYAGVGHIFIGDIGRGILFAITSTIWLIVAAHLE